MKKLNGWARLWIVLSCLMLAAILWGRTTWYPMRGDLSLDHESLNDAVQCEAYWERLDTAHPIRLPSNCKATRLEEAQANVASVRRELGKEYVNALADRRTWWIISFSIWIAASLALLLVGRWVLRGFRPVK